MEGSREHMRGQVKPSGQLLPVTKFAEIATSVVLRPDLNWSLEGYHQDMQAGSSTNGKSKPPPVGLRHRSIIVLFVLFCYTTAGDVKGQRERAGWKRASTRFAFILAHVDEEPTRLYITLHWTQALSSLR